MPVYGNILDGQQLLDLLNTGSDRRLRDSGNYDVLDWETGDLFYNGYLVAQWKYGDLFDGDGSWSLDWWDRVLVDSSGYRAIEWGNRTLLDNNGSTAVDWYNRRLLDYYGNTALDWSNPGDVRLSYRNLLEVNSIDVNGELQGGAGNGITMYGFRFWNNNGWNFIDTNGNLIANGDSSSGALLQGTSWNSGAFILGNDSNRGDGYIRAANLYVEADYLAFFGASPTNQQSSYGDVNSSASSNFWMSYGNDAAMIEDTASAVNYCLWIFRTFGFIAP